MGETFGERVLAPGAVVGAMPHVALVRFWTQGWRFAGRASRSEFWWCIAAETLVAVLLAVFVPRWLGFPSHWTLYADPLGAVPSVWQTQTLRIAGSHDSWWGIGGGDHGVWAQPYDVVVLGWLAVTALPRLTLLVRRLHDRNRSGYWVLALLLLGPFGAVVVAVMVLRSPVAAGERFDPAPWSGRPPRAGLVTRVEG